MTYLVERLRCQHTMSMFVTKDALIACLHEERDEAATALEAKDKELAALREENADLKFTFDFQWEADQRAIKAWQDAHPGKTHTWPDRCSMVIWMFECLAATEARAETAERERDEAREALKPFVQFTDAMMQGQPDNRLCTVGVVTMCVMRRAARAITGGKP